MAAGVAWVLLLLLGAAPPSHASTRARDTPHHRRTTGSGLRQQFSYDTPAYSHMLARPSDAFPEPKSGAWVYFVGVASAEKRHYLHWALSSIQCLQNAGTKYDFVVIFEGEDDIAIEALKAVGVHKVRATTTCLRCPHPCLQVGSQSCCLRYFSRVHAPLR